MAPPPLRALLAHLGDARPLLVAGYGLIALDALAQISAPAVFREVLHRIETDPDAFVQGGWRQPAIAALVVAGVFVVAAYFAHTFTWRGAARWSHVLRCRLYEHVQRLSLDFFQRSQAGDVAARLNQDIERLELTVIHGLGLWWSTIMLVVGIGYIVWVDAWMGLWAIGLLGAAAGWTGLLLPRLRRRARAVRAGMGATSATVAELLGANTVIKAFNAEDHAAEQVNVSSQRVASEAESLARLQFRYSDLLGLHVGFVAPFVLLFVGGWRAAGGSLLIGDVVAIWAFWQRASGSLNSIVANVPEVFAGMAAGERAVEILWEAPTVDDPPDAAPLRVGDASVRFEDVAFAYPSRPHQPVLDGFDLHVRGGHRVALVGPSGAGKSTVAQLLLRFYDPGSGRVAIAGQDLRCVDQGSVRAAIGVVFQDNVLLSGSLARNLRLAKADATDDELMAALEAAHAWEFVRRWEAGLDTELGERGVLLSGGQRQRLAIARVMLKDPAIVVLDEATSALDADSERVVVAALEHLLSGRTSLVIAHRMATVRRADRIVVVERGRIAAEGDHDGLLRTSPTYRGYCRQQFIA
jgi:ABC-type multidrug transport system fused ATPase/permease subunit